MNDLEIFIREPLLAETAEHGHEDLAKKTACTDGSKPSMLWKAMLVVTLTLFALLGMASFLGTETTLEIMTPSSPTANDEDDSVSRLSLIPIIHPFHHGSVVYTAKMNGDRSIEYKREVHAPCDYGMLLFSVGPAKGDLPYAYDIYEDAYLFSNNGNLCFLYPSYKGFQKSYEPFWKAMDPTTVMIKPLGSKTIHRISSRIVDPYNSNKTIDPQLAGDYIIIGKHNFYDPHFYQDLKNRINNWNHD